MIGRYLLLLVALFGLITLGLRLTVLFLRLVVLALLLFVLLLIVGLFLPVGLLLLVPTLLVAVVGRRRGASLERIQRCIELCWRRPRRRGWRLIGCRCSNGETWARRDLGYATRNNRHLIGRKDPRQAEN